MTKGKHTFKARPADAEAWNAEVERLRERVIKRLGAGHVDIFPASDFGGKATWRHRPAGEGRSPSGRLPAAEE